MSTTDTIEALVARGAAWLDENEPGWERRIDLGVLDMCDPHGCVLGQTVERFGVFMTNRRLPFQWAIAHGFCPERRRTSETERLWISLIKERFASGILSDERSA